MEKAVNTLNSNDRLMKFLQADPEKQARIDEILNGVLPEARETSTGPLLLGMGAGAKFLGVSRATFWRILRAGRLEKVEILPGAFRVRRADLEAFAAGGRGQVRDFPMSPGRFRTARRSVAM
jgi:predicted DNA-binding transcriptional regulator AlpA